MTTSSAPREPAPRDPAPHEQWEQLAVGHALDALEPDDEATFLGHSPGCSICRRVLDDTFAVMAGFAATVEPIEPPPALWAGIRDEVERSARAPIDLPPRVTSDAVTPAGPATPAAPPSGERRRSAGSAPAGPSGSRRPAGRRLVPAGRWAPSALVAAVVAAVVGLGAVVTSQLRGSTDSGGSQQAAAVLACVESPSCTPVRLSGPRLGAVAVAMVRGPKVTLLVDGLRPTAAGKDQYVLWQRGPSGLPQAVKSFAVDSTGRHVLDAGSLPVPGATTHSFAISHEAGTKIPSTPSTPILQGTAT